MKKLIVMLTAGLLVVGSADAFAQKKSKAEKNAEKAQAEMQSAALMERIVPAKNFQFIPYQYTQTSSGTVSINRYEYLRVRPASLEAYMTICPGVNTNRYEWISCELVKETWVIKMRAVAETGQNLDLDLAIRAKNGSATLKVRSNKSLDPNNPAAANNITYAGNIREY